jgi:transcriptional regulator with XRE-family HTH domain
MIYRIETEIKARMKELGLTTRELAYALKMSPGTLANQLGGWSPLSDENRKKIYDFISNKEKLPEFQNKQ